MAFKSISGAACTCAALSFNASAAVITFNNYAEFDVATDNDVLVENFQGLSPGPKGQILNLPNITVRNVPTGGNELFISFTGMTNFGIPTASQVLTGNGEENFDIYFNSPSTAIGFDTYVNNLGANEFVSVFGESNNLLGNFSLAHPGNVIGFFGVTADENISRIRFTANGGTVVNTGIDNILQAEAVVPVPAAVWLFGSGLLGLVGVARRKNK